ncbi:MAG: hypothetical protein RR048_01895 [Oscillospiraceae bacterium]
MKIFKKFLSLGLAISIISSCAITGFAKVTSGNSLENYDAYLVVSDNFSKVVTKDEFLNIRRQVLENQFDEVTICENENSYKCIDDYDAPTERLF